MSRKRGTIWGLNSKHGFFGHQREDFGQGDFGQGNFGQGNFGQGNFGQGNFGRGGGRGGGGRRGGGRGGSWRGNRNDFRGPPRGFGGFRGGRPQSFGPNPHWQNKPKRDSPGKRLSEVDIGVTEYISDHEGFIGIIKSRYSDFQVSEINEKGEIAKLTHTSPPAPPKEETVDGDEELLLTKYNLEILPMEQWDNINKLVVSKEASDQVVEIDVTGVSKEVRTKIHDAVKKAFGDCIVGSTVNVEDKKLVRFQKFRKGVRIDNRVKWSWPGEYVYFIVHKENCDTMDAAVRIAERLRLNIKPSMLGYAGTKDRRAKTSQWFSLRKVDPRKVAKACHDFRDLKVGNFTFQPTCLRLGMLKGNRFRIALRNVTAADAVVETACRQLQAGGFINYYGLQRFGTRVDTPTYYIGLKLLQGNFREAIQAILEEREGPIQHVLAAYRLAGAPAALALWPRHARRVTMELRLLKALAKNPQDLLGALATLARNNRLLYLHSYQSLVWNRAASERVRRLGLAPARGDLVPLTEVAAEVELPVGSDNEEEEDDADSENQDGAEKQKKDPKSPVESPLDIKDSPIETSNVKSDKPKVPAVKVLTQEDVDSGKYTIFDVILPLPGHSVEYPPNVKEFYEEILTKDGLTMTMKHKYKSYNMSGAYRHLAVRPLDVEWSTVRYSNPYCDLIRSDWDFMSGRKLDGILEDGKYKALLLNMTLPASCYATMALRELLKVDTSCDNQALQNNYHKKDTKTDEAVAEKEPEGDKPEEEKLEESVPEEGNSEPDCSEEVKNGDVKMETADVENGDEKIESEKRKLDDDCEILEAKKVKLEEE